MDPTRRRLVFCSAALLAGAGPIRGALAQAPASLEVPTVDRLAVRVLTDSSYDTPRPDTPKWVKVRRVPPPGTADFRRTLHNEWGLALGLESRIGPDTRGMLLDFGYTPRALLNNMELMGLDAAHIQALILSHGHYDHFGGLLGFLQAHRARLPADLALYVGGEDNFCSRKSTRAGPGHFSDFGVLDRRELAALDVRVVSCERPTLVLGHAFTTGNIARRSFERVLPNTVVEYAKTDGVGCDMPAAHAKSGGKPAPDEHLDEHATCFNVRDRGLIVISSCGHAGIVNTVRQAIDVSGVSRVHAVMGGFHLFPADSPYVHRTVAELKTLSPDVIIPLHCSGPQMVNALRAQIPEQLVTSTTGTEFVFGA